MKPSTAAITLIKQYEGFRSDAYKPLENDRWTIGYGMTYWPDGVPVKQGDLIMQAGADKLFADSLNVLAQKLSIYTSPTCTQNQFDAVLSLVYNIGLSAFVSSNTGKLFKAGKDISKCFELWNKSGGVVVNGLIKRRKAEAALYMKG